MTAPLQTVTEPVTAAAALMQASETARLRGDYGAGSKLAAQAAELARADGDLAAEAHALRVLANQQIRLGELEASVRACEDSASLLGQLGDDSGLCETLLVQAFSFLSLGLHEEALDILGSCRAIAQARDDQTQLYWVHNRFGVVYGCIGEHERAQEYLSVAAQQAEDIDDEARFCALNNLVDNTPGYVGQLREAGNDAVASMTLTAGLANADRALELARKGGSPYRESLALCNRAVLSGLHGDYDAAIDDLAESRKLAIEHGYRSLELATVQHEGSVSLWRGDRPEAAVLLEQAIELAVSENQLPVELAVLGQLSQAYEELGQFEQALRTLKRFRSIELKIKSSRADIRARLLAGQLDVDKAKLETDIAQLRGRTEQLQRAALSDVLTGIGNRRYLDDVLPSVLSDARSTGCALCIAVLDIDHFKQVNDGFGHGVGDEVLARVAQLILCHSRAADVLGRLGGEEFLIAFLDADLATAATVAERVRASIQDENWTANRPGMAVTVSIGIAELAPAESLAELIARADERMYQAKAAGRNRVESGSVASVTAAS